MLCVLTQFLEIHFLHLNGNETESILMVIIKNIHVQTNRQHYHNYDAKNRWLTHQCIRYVRGSLHYRQPIFVHFYWLCMHHYIASLSKEKLKYWEVTGDTSELPHQLNIHK